MRSTRAHVCSSKDPGFTLLELIVVIALLAVLVTLLIPTVAWAKARSRTATCMDNLKYLGTAFSMYDVESDGRVPPAAWRVRNGVEMAWDDWLDSYLGGNLTTEDKWAASYSGTNRMRYLICPEIQSHSQKRAPEDQARTYCMPRYIFEASRAPWPPRVRSQAGAGVVWNFGDGYHPDNSTVMTWELAELGREDGELKARKTQRQSSVATGLIRKPAETISLTERPGLLAHRGALEGATIDTAAEQLILAGAKTGSDIPANLPHQGRAQFLMFDGHIEVGLPQQTVGDNAPLDRQSGLWTISPRD